MCAQESENESASRPTPPAAAKSCIAAATVCAVPLVPPLAAEDQDRPAPAALRDGCASSRCGGAAERKRPRCVANGGGGRACLDRRVDRAWAASAPARAHGATKVSAKRGHGHQAAQSGHGSRARDRGRVRWMTRGQRVRACSRPAHRRARPLRLRACVPPCAPARRVLHLQRQGGASVRAWQRLVADP